MNRTWKLMVLMTYPLAALAQTGSVTEAQSTSTPYQPAVPVAPTVNSYGGGWPGYSGGGTAAGNAMNGMASVISAKGDYNLSTSAAAINWTQAQKNEIQNRQLYTNTYFDMRQTNRQAREAEQGPRLTMEQLARIAKQGAPKPLSPSQIDPVTGQIAWPTALQGPDFEAQRQQIDALFAQRAKYGGLAYADQSKAIQSLESMFDTLKAHIRQIPPQDYVMCRTFLQSAIYAASRTELQ